MADTPVSTATAESQALTDAFNAVLLPLAKLAVARGVHFGVLEEQLKQAFVQAAREANPGGLPHRQVSRISTATGINRREVTRLVSQDVALPLQKSSLAMRAYYRWSTEPGYQDAEGFPRPLPRHGEQTSFEALAAMVTRDVHPRSLLDDMQRLKLAHWDAGTDTVSCSADALIANDDDERMMGFLGVNVGDHLRAAVENVLGASPRHFEKSIRADGLTDESMIAARSGVEGQLKRVVLSLVQQLQKQVDASEAKDPTAHGEIRVGFYMYSNPAADGDKKSGA